MKLSSLEFPNVMHTVSDIDGTNGFKATVGTDEYDIRIPSGNYTSVEAIVY